MSNKLPLWFHSKESPIKVGDTVQSLGREGPPE